MIRKFVAERLSWIAMVVFLQGLIAFVAFVDDAIPLTPVLYIVFLSALLFGGFLTVRYYQETRFYRRLEEREASLDLSDIEADAASPFERIVADGMSELAVRLNASVSKHRIALEQEQDDLLSWIHEVKTPLTAIRLMIDRLNDESIKPQLLYEWLRIHLLLDQQLHRKRLPFMENDLSLERVDLETLFYTEIKTLQAWCLQKRLGFDMQLDAPEALSDSKWLAFIVRQLLTNAVKYSAEGAPDIVVRSFERDERCVLEIQDFGCGISAKDLPRIFDQGFTSTSRQHAQAATGMGLYLAKKAADSLHLHIDVRSEPGAGTTFALTFPKPNEFVRITGM